MRVVIVRDIEARSSFPADISSAGRARAFVRATLRAWDVERCADAAALAVSELVTNAVLHARSAPEVVLRVGDGRLRIEVHDASPTAPTRKHYAIDAGTGRGLLLVESLSTAWGTDQDGNGKSVWLELETESAVGDTAITLDAATLSDLADLDTSAGSAHRRRHSHGPPPGRGRRSPAPAMWKRVGR